MQVISIVVETASALRRNIFILIKRNTIKFWAEGGSTFTGGVRLNGASGNYSILLGNDVAGGESNAGQIG